MTFFAPWQLHVDYSLLLLDVLQLDFWLQFWFLFLLQLDFSSQLVFFLYILQICLLPLVGGRGHLAWVSICCSCISLFGVNHFLFITFLKSWIYILVSLMLPNKVWNKVWLKINWTQTNNNKWWSQQSLLKNRFNRWTINLLPKHFWTLSSLFAS